MGAVDQGLAPHNVNGEEMAQRRLKEFSRRVDEHSLGGARARRTGAAKAWAPRTARVQHAGKRQGPDSAVSTQRLDEEAPLVVRLLGTLRWFCIPLTPARRIVAEKAAAPLPRRTSVMETGIARLSAIVDLRRAVERRERLATHSSTSARLYRTARRERRLKRGPNPLTRQFLSVEEAKLSIAATSCSVRRPFRRTTLAARFSV